MNSKNLFLCLLLNPLHICPDNITVNYEITSKDIRLRKKHYFNEDLFLENLSSHHNTTATKEISKTITPTPDAIPIATEPTTGSKETHTSTVNNITTTSTSNAQKNPRKTTIVIETTKQINHTKKTSQGALVITQTHTSPQENKRTTTQLQSQNGESHTSTVTTRSITLHNKITKEMITYAHWSGSYTPDFYITINDEILTSETPKSITLEPQKSYTIAYHAKFPYGYSATDSITYTPEQGAQEAFITFDWHETPRIIINHA